MLGESFEKSKGNWGELKSREGYGLTAWSWRDPAY